MSNTKDKSEARAFCNFSNETLVINGNITFGYNCINKVSISKNEQGWVLEELTK